MCFSPQADLAGGIVVGAIGVDACRHLQGRNRYILLAGLPVLLGAHQVVETFVWWGVQGQMPHDVERIALWIYLLIAFVVLPVFVPVAVMALEPTTERRRQQAPFLAIGVFVSAVLLRAMVRGPIAAVARPHHIAYSLDVSHGGLVIALYVLAVCGTLLFSGYRYIVVFGVANLMAVAVLAWLTVDGFASLWCAYAAISAGAIALHMRYTTPHRSAPFVSSSHAEVSATHRRDGLW